MKLFSGLVTVGAVFAITAVRAEALPEFDAATITGESADGAGLFDIIWTHEAFAV